MSAILSIPPIRDADSHLLQSAAHLLTAELRLWDPALRPVVSFPTGAATATATLRILAAQASSEGRPLEGQAGDLPIFAIPITTAGQCRGILTAVLLAGRRAYATRAAGPAGDPAPVRAFLEDLTRALADQITRTSARGPSDDRAAADVELGLLRGIAERLGDPSDARNAYRFILDEGRAVAAADLGLLALQETRTLLISRPLETPSPGAWASTPLVRRLRDRLSERFDGSHERSLGGELARVLEAPAGFPAPAQLAAARLRLGNRRAGLIAFVRLGTVPFAPREIRLIEALAEQVGLALRGSELYTNLNEFLLSTVKALVSAVEAKDTYTSGHSTRVHVLAMLLGREIGLPRRQLESLKWGSILHDVGKIGLPEVILNKTGRLTAAEYEVVKEHPRRGYEVLRHIPQLRDAAQAVLLHHERIDGYGYPLGLCGEAIPPLARIVAVADTFDALTTTRPYRAACDMTSAFREIKRVAGRQLDGQIVTALGRMLPFLAEHRTMLALAVRPAAGE